MVENFSVENLHGWFVLIGLGILKILPQIILQYGRHWKIPFPLLVNKLHGILAMGFYLGGNQLSGIIPSSFFNYTKLQRVSLGENELTGVVPISKLRKFQQLTLLQDQQLSSNTTSLLILTALTNCSSLRKIEFSSNHLRGCLPSSIGQLSTKLHFINLGKNGLVGKIPLQIGNLTGSTSLGLSRNFFTGIVPSSLKMLQNLERLDMGGNRLHGNLAAQIG